MTWRDAEEIAELAIGKEKADDDPLAWWCLVELIMERARNPRHRRRRIRVRAV